MDVVEWGLTDGESEGDMSLNESEAADQDGKFDLVMYISAGTKDPRSRYRSRYRHICQ